MSPWAFSLNIAVERALSHSSDDPAAVVTLRASKLQERHGRVLKLVGGMLMLTLAVVMIVDPTLMNGLASSLAVFGVALAATALVILVHRVVVPRVGVRESPVRKG